MILHKKIAKLFGYDLIRRKKHPTLDTHVANMITHHGINLVLDVGANVGQFGRKLRQEGYKGEIHSFEPVSNTFKILEKTRSDDPLWGVHQLALGDACGQAFINITRSSDLSSFLAPNDFGKRRYKDITVSQKEAVEVDTIDHFLKTKVQNFADHRIFLKMDTQGYDLKVFDGARDALAHIVCILTELSLTPIYAEMPHYLQALKHYEDHGFAVTGIFPISRRQDMSIVEMDCMLVNQKTYPKIKESDRVGRRSF